MRRRFLVVLILLVSISTACTPKWAYTVESSFDEAFQVDAKLLESYSGLIVEDDTSCEGIPLEIVLYQNGIEVVESIEVFGVDGEITTIKDSDLIEDVCSGPEGEITVGEDTLYPEKVTVQENELVLDAKRIQDVTATTVYVLDLEMDGLYGTSLVNETYEHVALIFLDGFSYETFDQAMAEKLIPNIQTDSSVYRAITVYPPRTTTSSAAILTGLAPNESGVNKSGIRTTEAQTIFDAATEKGLTSVAIEGESLAFNLRNTTSLLSGDRDNNGGTDDNTYTNALDTLKDETPDLIWIHFHGIDDMGHTNGPIPDEVLAKAAEIDTYVGEILEILPENTLIIIFADHGMHYDKEEDEPGNHGNLIIEDMVIPIIIKTK